MKKIITIMVVALLWACSIPSDKPVSSNLNNTQMPDLSFYAHISNKKVGWGVGKDLDANGQPRDASEANKTYGRYAAIFVGPVSQKVYLTFDNGYENGNTPEILDTLKAKGVSAVFFLTGDYVKENPELVNRMINEGHIIGNHGYLHKSFPDVTLQEVYEEIDTLDAYMQQHFNYRMEVLRPPKGEFSERTLALTKSMGYQSVLWSVAYLDYDVNNQPDPTSSLKKLLDLSHPGAIYLLHSVSNTNTKILPQLIDGLRAKGYEVAKYDLIPLNLRASTEIEMCERIKYNVHCMLQ